MSKIRVPAGGVLARALFWVADRWLLIVEGAREVSGVSFLRALTPFVEAPSS